MTVQENDLDLMMSAVRGIGQKLSELKGRREQLAEERARNQSVVGAAKWRVDQKEVVEQVFENAQARLHAKLVGSYERLLTTIANDILPSEIKIRLELGTNRRNGKPSLDIVAQREGGDVDVSRATGGSLMNVLATGLRVSALSKSGARQFVAFDESECWISPDNVPAYGNVLVRLSSDLGFQCLLISHHDPRMFQGAFIVRLDGTPETGLVAITEGAVPELDAEETPDLFRSIRLVNFRSHSDTLVPISPGMTCLVGGNDIGKSAVVGALGAIIEGDFKDSDIRHGTRESRIEVTLADGRVVSVSKSPRKKMRWELRFASGQCRESEGAGVPDFVADALRMHQSEELSLHLARQSKPNFLLDDESKMGEKRAEVLSVGREASHLDRLMEAWQKRLKDDGSTIRKGEIEEARLGRQIAAMSILPRLTENAELLSSGLTALRASRLELVELARHSEQVQSAIDHRVALEDAASKLAPLAEPPILEETSELSSLLDRMSRTEREIASATSRQQVLADLAAPPELEPTEPFRDMADHLESAARHVDELEAERHLLKNLPETPALSDTTGFLEFADGLAEAMRSASSLEAEAAVLAMVPEPPALEEDDGLEEAFNRLVEVSVRKASLEREFASLSALTGPPDLEPTDGLIETAIQIEQASSDLRHLGHASAAMSNMTDPPQLEETAELASLAERMEANRSVVTVLKAEVGAIGTLAQPPELLDVQGLREIAAEIEAAAEARYAAEASQAALEVLSEPPALLPTDGYLELAARFDESARVTAGLLQTAALVDAEIAEAEERLRAWRDENDGICPTCGRDGFDPLSPGEHHAHY